MISHHGGQAKAHEQKSKEHWDEYLKKEKRRYSLVHHRLAVYKFAANYAYSDKKDRYRELSKSQTERASQSKWKNVRDNK
jgi:hypothetical protein